MSKTAILAGATGLTGGLLLQLLLEDRNYSKVIVISRRTLSNTHPKIKEIICAIDSLENYESELKGDILFCCLGTTITKAGSKEAFKKVDYEYPVKLAQIAKRNSIPKLMVVSAMGSDAHSFVFYNRVKGEMERDIAALQLDAFHIIRPSLIIGERNESRFGEGIAQKLSPLVDKILVGSLKKYKSIPAQQIAKAMMQIASTQTKGVIQHSNDELLDY